MHALKRPAAGCDLPLGVLHGVGPKRAERLAAAGFRSVRDLLFHLPSRYEDRRRVLDPGDVTTGGLFTVAGRLRELRVVHTRRRGFVIVRARLEGERGALAVRWFNQPYLARRYAEGDEVLLHGTAQPAGLALFELVNPAIRHRDDAIEARIVPVYPALAGFGPAATARLVQEAATVAAGDPVCERLPRELRARYAFPPLAAAFALLHRPAADIDLGALSGRATPAHQRLVYEELLDLHLVLADLRRLEVRVAKTHHYRIDDRARALVRDVLPFKLTGAQKRVVRELVEDLRRPTPMLRLLQGDVGSGKTIVAAIALLLAAQSGLQSVFMAPTELLAEQHFGNLRRLLENRFRVALVTSSASDAAVRADLASGAIQIAVGTQALIQRGVRWQRLGLAIVDEQHRFGVEQRRLLQTKGEHPDLLVMTATPIPRSLALTVYGDLDLSVIDELPPGRGAIETEVVPAAARREVYGRLHAELEAGAQAYVVFPLIEESDEISAASLAALGDRVRTHLADFPSAVLHGRVPAEERERIAREFARGTIRLLVATTVIEVGIDVPAASWMVIESAERFGLAQLHQLRGRVGRGSRPSRCVAIHGRLSATARRRLEIFAAELDGFRIAEADLEIRGPGDLLGKRQAGLPRLRVASLVSDRDWIERTRADAREIVSRASEPEFAALLANVRARNPERAAALAGG